MALLYPINYASASFLLLDSSCHQSMRTLLNLQYLTISAHYLHNTATVFLKSRIQAANSMIDSNDNQVKF